MPSGRDTTRTAAPHDVVDFAGAVLLVVSTIPPGRVMTYGDVAAELSSRGARAVGRVMATEGSSVPWWRVVRADGRPPAGHERDALDRYLAEGTPLRQVTEHTAYRLDLTAARWVPWRDAPDSIAPRS